MTTSNRAEQFLQAVISLAERMNISPIQLLTLGVTSALHRTDATPIPEDIPDDYVDKQCIAAELNRASQAISDVLKEE